MGIAAARTSAPGETDDARPRSLRPSLETELVPKERQLYLRRLMPRLIVRRSLTAVGIYSSVVLGFLGTVVATRELHSARHFGDFATVLFATGFLQSFFDLTVEEALVKYGFRYISREDWGRLRRLFSSALRFKLAGPRGGLGLVVFAFVAHAAAPDAAARRRRHSARLLARRARRLGALPAQPLRHPLRASSPGR